VAFIVCVCGTGPKLRHRRAKVDLGMILGIYEIWEASGRAYTADRCIGGGAVTRARWGRRRIGIEWLMPAQGRQSQGRVFYAVA
jgi:hypothetical protein